MSPSFEVHFDVYCDDCGAGLCHTASTDTNRRGGLSVSIPPCEKCMDKARDEADSFGYDRGYEIARSIYDKEE